MVILLVRSQPSVSLCLRCGDYVLLVTSLGHVIKCASRETRLRRSGLATVEFCRATIDVLGLIEPVKLKCPSSGGTSCRGTGTYAPPPNLEKKLILSIARDRCKSIIFSKDFSHTCLSFRDWIFPLPPRFSRLTSVRHPLELRAVHGSSGRSGAVFKRPFVTLVKNQFNRNVARPVTVTHAFQICRNPAHCNRM